MCVCERVCVCVCVCVRVRERVTNRPNFGVCVCVIGRELKSGKKKTSLPTHTPLIEGVQLKGGMGLSNTLKQVALDTPPLT